MLNVDEIQKIKEDKPTALVCVRCNRKRGAEELEPPDLRPMGGYLVCKDKAQCTEAMGSWQSESYVSEP